MTTRLQETINDDSVDISLLEAVSSLSLRANAAGRPGKLALGINRQTLPGSQFERKLRHTLNTHYQNLLLQLPPMLQERFPQLNIHAQKTFSLTLLLLRLLNLSEEQQTTIALAAFFHDIGKLEIDERLLDKPGEFTPQEFALIKGHPAAGANLLNRYTSLSDAAALVYHHHECWDGRGYPDGLAGEAIPLGARIIAIADAFDAMTSNRVYQSQRTPREAFEELQRCAGTQFDPLLAQLFCAGKLIAARRTSIARSYPANH